MYRRQMYKRRIGTRIGYRHSWHYNGRWNEQKIAPRLWRFRFRAIKRRGGSSYGGLKRGGMMVWKINGIQVAKKIGGRAYMTDFRGYKKQLGYSVNGRRIRWNRR